MKTFRNFINEEVVPAALSDGNVDIENKSVRDAIFETWRKHIRNIVKGYTTGEYLETLKACIIVREETKFNHKEYQPNNGGYVADGSYGITLTMIDHN